MQARTAKYLFGFFAWHVVLFFFLRRQPKYEAPVLGPMLPFPSVSLTPAFDSQLRGCANFTRVLVIPKTKAEDVDWVQRAVDAGWGVVFYHVDGIDPSEVDKTSVGNGTIDGASESWGRVEHRRTPSNKGHEVIVSIISRIFSLLDRLMTNG